MPEWLIKLLFTLMGAFIGIVVSSYTIGKQEKLKALAKFRCAFIDEILYLKNPDLDTRKSITPILNLAESKHRRAIEILMPFLNYREKQAINKSYKNFRYPYDTKDSFNENIPFGLYNLKKDIVKQTTNKDMDGRELAVKNLYDIIYAVK